MGRIKHLLERVELVDCRDVGDSVKNKSVGNGVMLCLKQAEQKHGQHGRILLVTRVRIELAIVFWHELMFHRQIGDFNFSRNDVETNGDTEFL